MKKQEVLDFMKWDELPKSAKASNLKCPVLVERTNKARDYAISNKGKIVADKKFKAMITKVIEYYPEKVITKADIAKIEADRIAAKKKEKAAADKIIADKAIAEKAEAEAKAKVIADAKIVADRLAAEEKAAEKAAEEAKAIADKVIADEKAAEEKAIADKAEAAKIDADKNKPTVREAMIEFLVSKKSKREVVETKTNDELITLCKKFGKEF